MRDAFTHANAHSYCGDFGDAHSYSDGNSYSYTYGNGYSDVHAYTHEPAEG